MAGPLDIYAEDSGYSRSSSIPDIGGFFANPMVMGATLFTDMMVVPKLMNRGGMLRSMNKLQRRSFLTDARRATGGVSPSHVERYMLTASEKKMRTTMGIRFADRYGTKAAARMSVGRGLAAFSRFSAWYAMWEIGSSVAGILGDAIMAYEPSPYVNKRKQVETGGFFVDTRQAQTQRMRAIQAIHNTQISTRAALGNEAAFMHLER